MRTTDTRTGYGWVSIALHWTTAIIVLTLWFVGSSIQSDPGTQESTLRLHTSIAITAYLLLWARVIWRLKIGHPGPLPKQGGLFYQIGKYTHYTMCVAIAFMLITGPLMLWLKFGGFGGLNGWFQVKLALVGVAIVTVGLSEWGFARLRRGDEGGGRLMSVTGPLTTLTVLAIVLAAVFTFN